MMKRLLILLLLIPLISTSAACKESGPAGTAELIVPVYPIDTPWIPMMAWIGVPQDQTTISRYQEMRATGITHSFSLFSDANQMQKALDTALRTGVKMFVSCPELKTAPEATVRRFMTHPALAGYYLADEPGSSEFARLGEWTRRIQAIDNAHPCYVNLLPNFAETHQLGTATYREYIKAYIKEVPTQILSFDHYPIIGNSNLSIRPEWYENLEIFAGESAKAGKPFWAFALTVAHSPYPIPTRAALRLQVYSNLAYGAQGIQYFTYWNLYDPGGYDFHDAPIALDGQRTEVYGKLTQMNQEIKQLSHVFLGAKLISVAHTGTTIPNGTTAFAVLPAPVKALKTEGMGAVVSVLEKGADQFLVVVNRDVTETMKLTVLFETEVKKMLKDGSAMPVPHTDTVVVEPGDVAIYNWPKP